MAAQPRARSRTRRWIWLPLGALALLGGAEAAARLSGVADVPLYVAGGELGYIPAPNQSGAFLRTRDWVFNELSMGTTRFAPDPACNVLLVGDSIVLGGNPYRQADKLGPQLERRIACRVWPISAGSWALLNELIYLEMHHSDVVERVQQVVIVSNSGDFAEPSAWRSDLTHPRTRPLSAFLYGLRRYAFPPGEEPAPAVPQRDWTAEWRRRLGDLLARVAAPVAVVLYPDRSEQARPDSYEAHLGGPRAALRQAGVTTLVELGADPRWNGSLYRDDIHPTPAGTAILADVVADALARQGVARRPGAAN
jgi:hypothetical protein